MEKKEKTFNFFSLFIILIQMIIVFFLTGRLEDTPYLRGLLIFLVLLIGHFFIRLFRKNSNSK